MRLLILLLVVAVSGCLQSGSSGADGEGREVPASSSPATGASQDPAGGGSTPPGGAGNGSATGSSGQGSTNQSGPGGVAGSQNWTGVEVAIDEPRIHLVDCRFQGGLGPETASSMHPFLPRGYVSKYEPLALAAFELMHCEDAYGLDAWLAFGAIDVVCQNPRERCRGIVEWYVSEPHIATELDRLGFTARMGSFDVAAAPQEVAFNDGNVEVWRLTDPAAGTNVGKTTCDEAGLCSWPAMTFRSMQDWVTPGGDAISVLYDLLENTRGREESFSFFAPGTSFFAAASPYPRVLEADNRGFGNVTLL